MGGLRLTAEEAAVLLDVLRDLGTENVSEMRTAGVSVYHPFHLGKQDFENYRFAIEKLSYLSGAVFGGQHD